MGAQEEGGAILRSVRRCALTAILVYLLLAEWVTDCNSLEQLWLAVINFL